jgi:hypothetical protein
MKLTGTIGVWNNPAISNMDEVATKLIDYAQEVILWAEENLF